jgi:hypothetical protein
MAQIDQLVVDPVYPMTRTTRESDRVPVARHLTPTRERLRLNMGGLSGIRLRPKTYAKSDPIDGVTIGLRLTARFTLYRVASARPILWINCRIRTIFGGILAAALVSTQTPGGETAFEDKNAEQNNLQHADGASTHKVS